LINQFDPEKNASNFRSNINILGGEIHQGFKARQRNVFSGTIEQKSIVYQDTNHLSQSGISSKDYLLMWKVIDCQYGKGLDMSKLNRKNLIIKTKIPIVKTR